MKRSLLLYFFAGLTAVSALSQVELRMSDRLKLNGLDRPLTLSEMEKGRHEKGSRSVELLVRYEGPDALDAIREAGGMVVSLVGNHTAIVQTSAGAVDAIAACEGVRGVKLSEQVKPVNMVAREASNVDAVHAGTSLPLPYTGKGVIVGVYDIGVDPNHINFLDNEGENRIKNLWHYEDFTAKATVYDTPKKIAGFDTDYGESHGTHVMGVLGGSFVDPEHPEYDYRGMAPEAELAVAAGLGYNAQILDALERIGKYAQEEGKPCVINISFGDNVGPHDGTDEFTEAINDIADKYGAIVCMAAGNERDQDISFVKEFSASYPELKTLLLKGSTDMDATFQTFGTIEIYGQDDTPFEVYLDIINRSNPDEVLYTLQIPEKKASYLTQGDMIGEYIENTYRLNLISEGTPFQEIYSNSFAGGICEVDPYNNRYHAQLNTYLVGRTSTQVSRNFMRLRIKGQEGKKVFVYCDGTYMNFGTKNMPGLDKPDGNGTNSNMGSGKSTISVGSYVTANIQDSPYSYGNVGDISWFSSFGETPDGRFIPEITAPGQVIISSRNTYLSKGTNALYVYPVHYTYTDKKTRKSYDWTSCAGTSQASPHVAGIIALWLQANPKLTTEQVKEILAKTAVPSESTEPGWGAGMIDAYAGLKAALSKADVQGVVNEDAAVAFDRRGNVLEALVAGAERVSIEVYTLSGTMVRSTVTNGIAGSVNLDGLDHGVYVVRVNSDSATKSIKITL